jgi:hypothetical protein
MAQDPEREEADRDQDVTLDSHALDMATIYESSSIEGEMEAEMIRGVLESNGIASILVRTPYPPLGFSVKVPRGKLKEAQRLIDEAEAAGPEAAAEAEAASEE